jgi:hypothetical protein
MPTSATKQLKRRCEMAETQAQTDSSLQGPMTRAKFQSENTNTEHRQSFKQATHATFILSPAQITAPTKDTPWVIQAMICSTSQRFDLHYHDGAVAQDFGIRECVALRILRAIHVLFVGASLWSEASVARSLTFTFFPSHSRHALRNDFP